MHALRHGDVNGAALQANTILRSRPHAAEGHRLMALALWRQRDAESALSECAEALTADPSSVSMMALESVGLWKLNRKKEAQQALVRTFKSQPQIIKSQVFCRQILCDAADIGLVSDFLKHSRWVVMPPADP